MPPINPRPPLHLATHPSSSSSLAPQCHSLLHWLTANRASSFAISLAFLCYCMSATAKTREMSTVSRASLDQKRALSKRCSREATLAGAKAAAVATIASAIPTLASVRMLPWAKANINPTGQALIISTVAGMAYFIAADKKILSLARRHSFEEAPQHLRNTSFQGTGRLHPAFFRP
ncbi:early nodulin-93-like [Miscanthus floridulus]|uniref:early nodulin-93-like n=1 Tax=Miscanthus floridulus TaxID=154761 RepID=UPI0034593AC1